MFITKKSIIGIIKLAGIISTESRLGSRGSLNLNDLSDSITKAFSFKNISTNMVARGVRSFGILEGATGTLIEICPKFFYQFNADMW